MACIFPFAAIRPRAELAHQLGELPYDVPTTEEARAVFARKPLSFFQVSKPEVLFPPGSDPYDPQVYSEGRKRFDQLLAEGALRQDETAQFYVYRQEMGTQMQTGVVALAGCHDYLEGRIRPHELTRPEKEDDRVRHIEALDAQTGPAFLIFRGTARIAATLVGITAAAPVMDFRAPDGVRHVAWTVSDAAVMADLAASFEALPRLYIADGHHRTAAAVRVYQRRGGTGGSAGFLAVLFPQDQLRILPYHRVLRDLNGLTATQALERVSARCRVEICDAVPSPGRGEVGWFLDGRWRRLIFGASMRAAGTLVETLDVALLQRHVLGPVFGIEDPRRDPRLQFVGGLGDATALAGRVEAGEFQSAFLLAPTAMEDLLTVADAGEVLPPKSTWFEPKLRDGLFSHRL